MAISYNSIELNRLLPPGDPAYVEEIVMGLGLHERTTAGPRPHVLLNMVATVDGRATLEGRSGPISGEADRAMFHALRTVVDAVMAGAGTVRTERYGPIVRDPERRRARIQLGLAERPLACIVSASLDLPPQLPLLADPDSRVAILTPSSRELPQAAADDTGAVSEAGTMSDAGATSAVGAMGAVGAVGAGAAELEYVRTRREDGSLDLAAALAELQDRLQVRTLLCEGGPHLNRELLAEGLVDELFLSVSPLLAGGDPLRTASSRPRPARFAPPTRILAGAELQPPAGLELKTVLEHESQLFLRYGVRAEPRG